MTDKYVAESKLLKAKARALVRSLVGLERNYCGHLTTTRDYLAGHNIQDLSIKACRPHSFTEMHRNLRPFRV